MIYALWQWLEESYNIVPLFRFITFRAAFASIMAFVLVVKLGPSFIRRIEKLQFGQTIRDDGPASHMAKQGTPTMGGVLFVSVFLVTALLVGNLSNLFVVLILVGTMAFAMIGFIDDFLCIVRKSSKGLSGRLRLFWEAAITGGIVLILLQHPEYTSELWVPFAKDFHPEISWLYLPLAIMVVTGTANGVNLTDGLDGLATGVALPVLGALGVIAYATGHATIARYLGIFFSAEVGELTVLVGAFIGALMGFLWHNAHPASMFMGDTGSLAIGGFIGLVAVVIKQELLLPIIGFVFVMETVSVLLQVGSYKMRKKRIFKMAPIHHHFELSGWAENKVIVRFWIIGVAAAVIGIAMLKVR